MSSKSTIVLKTKNWCTAYAYIDVALTRCNDHVKTMDVISIYSMYWDDIKVKLIEDYYHKDEMQNMEHERWNLMIKGLYISPYATRFNDLVILCLRLITPEYKKVEHYILRLAP